MRIIQHVNSRLSPRRYKLLRFFHLLPDYMVENEKTLSITVFHNGVTFTIPLIKDANILDMSGRVGEAAGRIFRDQDWECYPFQRRYNGAVYSGVTAQRK